MAIFSSDLTSYSPEYIESIADAIRLKNGTDTKYRVSEMAQAIKDIPSGGDTNERYFQFVKSSSTTFTYEETNTKGLSHPGIFAGAYTKIEIPNVSKVYWPCFTISEENKEDPQLFCPNLKELHLQTAGTDILINSYDTNYTIPLNKLTTLTTIKGNFAKWNRVRFANMTNLKYLDEIQFNQPYYPTRGERTACSFYNCTGLESVTLGRTSNSLFTETGNTGIFEGCSNLKEVILNSTQKAWYASNAFTGCASLEHIYVPDSLYDTYMSDSNWKRFPITKLSERPTE